MIYRIEPSSLSGTIEIPPSKSHTHRALLFALLASGTSTIHKFLDSPDSQAMLSAIEMLGAQVKQTNDTLEIIGVGGNLKSPKEAIDVKNSGIILRFIGALTTLLPSDTIITGDLSIQTRRPMKPLVEALKELGAFAKSMKGDGYAPLMIRGPLQGGTCILDGEDSQPVSALLIASSFAENPTEIHVKNPGEKPWIDVTLYWLKFLGLPYERQGYHYYRIPGKGAIKGFTYTVPGDFSSLAFPLAAALVTQSEITIKNIDQNDVQGDKKLLEILKQMGAQFHFEENTLHVKKGQTLKGCTIDINDMIDSITILAVIGCYAEGETIITNGVIARSKECDRIHAIVTELKKMGADIEEKEEGLIVRSSFLKGARVKTYDDHRMAMSLTVAALGARGTTTIDGAACSSKTYPYFREAMQGLGGNIR